MRHLYKRFRLLRSVRTKILLAGALLLASSADGQTIRSFRQENRSLICHTDSGTLRLQPMADNAVRVRFVKEPVHDLPEWIYIDRQTPDFRVEEHGETLTLTLPRLTVTVDKPSGRLAYFSSGGETLLREEGRRLLPARVQDEKTYEAQQAFRSPTDEYLYGLGQFQDGQLNVRGLTRRLTQVNTQIAIPFILSNKGYGLLWNNYGLTDFNPADGRLTLTPEGASGEKTVVDVTSTEGGKQEVREGAAFTATWTVPQKGRYALLLDVGRTMARRHQLEIDGKVLVDIRNTWLPPTTALTVELDAGTHSVRALLEKDDRPTLYYKPVDDRTVFRSPVADAVDYTLFAGTPDEVIAGYRILTGDAPLMPDWALGYIHCRERFHSQEEILATANRFRAERLPVDVIVQDWQYWGKYGWNAMRFDEEHYPDPAALVRDLHARDLRFMVSVWSKVDPQSEVGRRLTDKGYYIPGTSWVDFFNPHAAACYWQEFSSRLLRPYGIDAWWQDATEPENDDLVGRRITGDSLPGELLRNVYPLLVTRTVYEGARRDVPDKRTMILTRSGFPGMQRYAAATWSGDVGHDWDTFRRQLTAGLGMMASGLPWWTYDAGGFFRPANQYTDAAYRECFLRWLQTSVFLPLMRVHGYMSDTEFWNYGPEVTRQARAALAVRYRLFPYLYAGAADITFRHGTLMRPLVMDFPHDTLALRQTTEYMFGPALLVAPVTAPGLSVTDVYLPATPGGWYDFWTGLPTDGDSIRTLPVSPEHIPVFVRAGSILPLAEGELQSTVEARCADWEIHIYAGADGSFTLYEDEGTNYRYEQGACATVRLTWDDARRTLTLHPRQGSFEGMRTERPIRLILHDRGQQPVTRPVTYDGRTVMVSW